MNKEIISKIDCVTRLVESCRPLGGFTQNPSEAGNFPPGSTEVVKQQRKTEKIMLKLPQFLS